MNTMHDQKDKSPERAESVAVNVVKTQSQREDKTWVNQNDPKKIQNLINLWRGRPRSR